MLLLKTFLITGLVFTSTCFLLSGSFVEHNVGDHITLTCSISEKSDIMYWFRQNVGHVPTLISTLYSFDKRGMFYGEFANNERFGLTPDNRLNISKLQVTDTATYYCASSQLYKLTFSEGTSVVVRGTDSYIEAEIHQSPSEGTEPGKSVVLNCSVQTESCEGRHRVHWFKQFEESVAGLLYSHGGSGDQCENKTDSPTNSCVYSLPVHNASSEQTGTYYCAVAACGHLLFGKGTKLNVLTESAQVTVLSAALTFTSVVVVLLALLICILNKRKSTESYIVSTSYKTISETIKKGDVLYYVAMEQRKSQRSRRHRDDTWSECVYFNVQ
ncbi:uncharacterized protein LOC110168899 [Boleophthalmus pectinirostris]|uniref:uncharacterized protein LOC110168899 n=1 Tax=Boleophthalmus pectinirostris TaxID=150288 RepID=UPI00242F8C37|nr:uncharacterized protein LOC110168899 [Boleophthalmus pectinirostris]